MAEGGGGLDQFLTDLGTTDAKKKLTTGQVTTLFNLANFFCLKLFNFDDIITYICLVRTSSTILATLLQV